MPRVWVTLLKKQSQSSDGTVIVLWLKIMCKELLSKCYHNSAHLRTRRASAAGILKKRLSSSSTEVSFLQRSRPGSTIRPVIAANEHAAAVAHVLLLRTLRPRGMQERARHATASTGEPAQLHRIENVRDIYLTMLSGFAIEGIESPPMSPSSTVTYVLLLVFLCTVDDRMERTLYQGHQELLRRTSNKSISSSTASPRLADVALNY
ncbi:hypothetical protein DFH09DRAFT_1086116 [Mycena vulgaris]|nr:hypothetical protein DFH09DRAFT_1086116 [Mycena vulgaris]